ncbi:MAG TPA: glycerophosphodiester phosphodiesterase [Gammaproteobacteria bacterium]|nr:glycerophosphodiester phosphodiesterase [Gammaproteobacteria bacterium]
MPEKFIKSRSIPPLKDVFQQGRCLLVAHRGNTLLTIENTLEGFKQALLQGADILECDVQLSKEGVPVVFHDQTSSRLVPDEGSSVITNTPIEAMRTWELRSKDMTGKLCTLEEMLHECSDRAYFYLEIKTFAEQSEQEKRALIEAVWLLVDEKFDIAKQCILVSFDEMVMHLIHSMDLGVLTGLNFEKSMDEFKGMDWLFGSLSAVCPNLNLLESDSYAYWKERGFFVIPYTVNSESDLEVCKTYEVDAITTDRVGYMRGLLDNK